MGVILTLPIKAVSRIRDLDARAPANRDAPVLSIGLALLAPKSSIHLFVTVNFCVGSDADTSMFSFKDIGRRDIRLMSSVSLSFSLNFDLESGYLHDWWMNCPKDKVGCRYASGLGIYRWLLWIG
jgi:hypothetical protein